MQPATGRVELSVAGMNLVPVLCLQQDPCREVLCPPHWGGIHSMPVPLSSQMVISIGMKPTQFRPGLPWLWYEINNYATIPPSGYQASLNLISLLGLISTLI